MLGLVGVRRGALGIRAMGADLPLGRLQPVTVKPLRFAAAGQSITARSFSAEPMPSYAQPLTEVKPYRYIVISPRQKLAAEKLRARRGNPKVLEMPTLATPKSMSHAMGIRTVDVLKALILSGHRPQTSEDVMTPELADQVAKAFYFVPKRTERNAFSRELRMNSLDSMDPKSLVPRQPTVTVLGHVDHGKTTLLDTLSNRTIAEKEAGGITQRLSAFQVAASGDPNRKITFVDTPGHAAFSSMRQKGSKFTDLVVLIVAVDDGVQPQTLEAIQLIQEAQCAMVVALNKVDKGAANIPDIKQELLNNGVMLEEYGGDVPVVEISARNGTNLDQLMDAILLRTEELELKTTPKGNAEGFLLESRLDPHRGSSVCGVVRIGTLKVGDHVVADSAYGRVKSMQDENGKTIYSATPGCVVHISGFKGIPKPGSEFVVVKDEKTARDAAEWSKKQQEKEKSQQQISTNRPMLGTGEATVSGSLARSQRNEAEEEPKGEEEKEEEESKEEEKGKEYIDGVRIVRTPRGKLFDVPDDVIYGTPEHKTLSIIARVDTSGSAEALKKLVTALTETMKAQGHQSELLDIRLLNVAVGQLAESDITAAQEANAMVLCFNTRPTARAKAKAKYLGVRIQTSQVIFDLLDKLVDKSAELLPKKIEVDRKGRAEIATVFEVSLKGNKKSPVAGCKITEGVISANQRARLIRDGKVIYQGHLQSLKHFKKSVSELKSGNECGITLADWEDYQPGDVIESYVVKAVPQRIILDKQFSQRISSTTTEGSQ